MVDGNLLRHWGGPGEGYEWVGASTASRSTSAASSGSAGNADNDNAILNSHSTGKFVMQIGKIAPSKGSATLPQLGKPAETAIDKDANEIYVADGYGNRRVIVFDATTGATSGTGAPMAIPPMTTSSRPTIPRRHPQQFANPWHCVKLSNDRPRLCLRPHQ